MGVLYGYMAVIIWFQWTIHQMLIHNNIMGGKSWGIQVIMGFKFQY